MTRYTAECIISNPNSISEALLASARSVLANIVDVRIALDKAAQQLAKE